MDPISKVQTKSNHTLSEPGSHSPHLNRYKRVTTPSQGQSSGSSNYILMQNVTGKSSSDSFHTIQPSVTQPSPPAHLQLSSNTIHQQIELPLSFVPSTSPNKFSQYQHSDPIREQEQQDYKFEFMEIKSLYQQLKESHEMLVRDYEVERQKLLVVRNNEEYLGRRNDELAEKNIKLEDAVYKLEEELRAMRMNKQQDNVPNVGLKSSNIIYMPRPTSSTITIRPVTSQIPVTVIPPPIIPSIPVQQPSLHIVNQPTLLQLEHENRQLLYRVQEYESSIGYKNQEITRLNVLIDEKSHQLQQKAVQISSLRREIEAYVRREDIYQQNEQLVIGYSTKVESMNKEVEEVKAQCRQLIAFNDKLKAEVNRYQQIETRCQQLQTENQLHKQRIALMENINKQQQQTQELHQKLINQINQSTRIQPSSLLYQQPETIDYYHGVNQDLSKVLTTYIGDDQLPYREQRNQDYQKINAALYNNLKNVVSNQRIDLEGKIGHQNAAMRLADHLVNGSTDGMRRGDGLAYAMGDQMFQQPQNYPFSNSFRNPPKQHHNHSRSNLQVGQQSDGMMSSKYFNRESSNLQIQDEGYFDFGKQNSQIRPSKPQNVQSNLNEKILPNMPSDNSLSRYDKVNLVDKLKNQTLQYFDSENILSFPQLPFKNTQEQSLQRKTVTFMDQMSGQGNASFMQKQKRHYRIFPQEHIKNVQNSSGSFETLQRRIVQLAEENKSLRHYLVKKTN